MNDARLERMVDMLDKGIEIQKLSSWNNRLILTRGIFLSPKKGNFTSMGWRDMFWHKVERESRF